MKYREPNFNFLAKSDLNSGNNNFEMRLVGILFLQDEYDLRYLQLFNFYDLKRKKFWR